MKHIYLIESLSDQRTVIIINKRRDIFQFNLNDVL